MTSVVTIKILKTSAVTNKSLLQLLSTKAINIVLFIFTAYLQNFTEFPFISMGLFAYFTINYSEKVIYF